MIRLVLAITFLLLPGSGFAEESERYAAAGRRDPFRPLSMLRAPGPQPMEPRTPLERYELAQLRLVGVVRQVDPPRAMVEDSAGLGFILTPGTPIGRDGGVVSEIGEREVLVEECYTNVIGEQHCQKIALSLPTDESEFLP